MTHLPNMDRKVIERWTFARTHVSRPCGKPHCDGEHGRPRRVDYRWTHDPARETLGESIRRGIKEGV